MRNKTFRLMVVVFCAFALTGSSVLAQAGGFKATISPSEASFEFPIDPNYEYSWNSGGLTYAWNVKTVNPKCEVGFSLSTAQGAGVSEEGDINKVLAAGDFSAFCGGRIRNDIQVSGFANESKDKLTIVLTGQNAIKLLFGARPKYVTFERVLELFEKPKVSRVNVIYATGGTPANAGASGGGKITSTGTKKSVATDFLSQLDKGMKSGLKLDRLIVVENYALQNWSNKHMGGEALLKFSTSSKKWMLVEMGGGAWDIQSLVEVGVPQRIAALLVK